MKVKVEPSKVRGEILAPPSKSYTHRAIILASLADGCSIIKNCLLADDTFYTLCACQSLGVKADLEGNTLKIAGTGGNLKVDLKRKKIFVGNSGTTMRFLTSVAALAKEEVVLAGEKRLCQRPMAELLLALQDLGIKVKSINNNGCPPIKLEGGNLEGGKIEISGKTSSQFISSLLLVAPFAKRDVVIKIKNGLKSQPYVEITIDLMRRFGVRVKNNHYQSFFIKSGQRYKARKYQVEGDYTSSSYFFAAAAITNSKVKVNGLNINSAQGDKHFLFLLKRMGCQVKEEKGNIVLIGAKRLKGIRVEMKDYPDIVQTLAVVGAFAQGKTEIKNIAHLKYKETDRIVATALEFAKMGIEVETTKDSITIYGGKPKGARIKTYRDHRMALSFAVAGLGAKGETIIEKAEVVSKSYPQFFKDLKKLGAKLKEIK